MARQGREIITLQCSECKRRNYSTTKNKKTMTEKLELKKFCRHDRKHTVHRETNAEMKKVTWPNRTEVVGTTVVVLVATVVFAVYLWGCDVVFYKAINLLFTKFGASVGA